MKFKKLESGRSMVEMLGVLAIIGVLSVGGIAGYSLSMRRHRANGVVDAVAKYEAITYGRCQQKLMNGDIASLTECGSGMPIYIETDLGALPAGVTYIYHGYIEQDTTTGVDTTVTGVEFSDKKLCQAVASVVGGTCSSDNWIHDFKIKQN